MLQAGIVEDVHASHAIGEEEQIVCVIPRYLVDLKAERLLHPNLVGARVDKCYQILLVAHGNCFAIRRPGNVYILALGTGHRNTLGHSNVPNPNCLVATGRAELVGIRFVPTQLIHGCRVTPEHIVLHEAIALQGVYGDCLVKRSRSQVASSCIQFHFK